MEPRIALLSEKKLIGMRLKMSIAQNRTYELWQRFMPEKKKILNAKSTDLFSMQIYSNINYFTNFNPKTEFEKWATIEVENLDSIPEGMDSFILPSGLYAVFIHHGPASEGEKTFNFIFKTWLPDSPYELDDRPHFEILGEKYKNDDPHSEEEVWVPVKLK